MSAAFSILRRNKPVEIIRLQTGMPFIQLVINRRISREMKSVQLMHPPPGFGVQSKCNKMVMKGDSIPSDTTKCG